MSDQPAATEEAVVNAVYHRSYEIREPVEIRITPTDLIVFSYPGPTGAHGAPFAWINCALGEPSPGAIAIAASGNF